jgi:general L-amino acid transport system substrate-binding protein
VLLPQTAPAHALSDLRGRSVCFMIGAPVWPILSRELASRNVAFRPFGFSEDVEMKDAYNVGRCDAVAGLASDLDELRGDQGVKHLQSRLLDEELGADPVDAMVPVGDPGWLATVRASIAP